MRNLLNAQFDEGLSNPSAPNPSIYESGTPCSSNIILPVIVIHRESEDFGPITQKMYYIERSEKCFSNIM